MLTRTNINAIRAADAAVLRFDLAEESGSLSLEKHLKRPDGFGENTRRVHIEARAQVTQYGAHTYPDDPANSTLAPPNAGVWGLQTSGPTWQTLALLVRAGDTLTQRWTIDNRNSLLKRARLTAHQVALIIERPVRNSSTRRLTFQLASVVTNPFSTADLVTRASNEDDSQGGKRR
jgi:hypothetical protein